MISTPKYPKSIIFGKEHSKRISFLPKRFEKYLVLYQNNSKLIGCSLKTFERFVFVRETLEMYLFLVQNIGKVSSFYAKYLKKSNLARNHSKIIEVLFKTMDKYLILT